MSTSVVEVLELAAAAYGVLSRPTLSNFLNFGRHSEIEAARRQTLWRLQRQNLLERVAHGDEIIWRLTKVGRLRLAELRNTSHLRRRRWDGRWRLVMFDFPEASRKQRDAFRWWLRVERLGLLQKSVWISAFPLNRDLRRFLEEAGALHWILLFESPEKGPVTDAQMAAQAWPLERLADDYGRYIARWGGRLVGLKRGGVPSAELVKWRIEELTAYEGLLRRDPFLPKALLPLQFPGEQADEIHDRFLRTLVRCLPA